MLDVAQELQELGGSRWAAAMASRRPRPTAPHRLDVTQKLELVAELATTAPAAG